MDRISTRVLFYLQLSPFTFASPRTSHRWIEPQNQLPPEIATKFLLLPEGEGRDEGEETANTFEGKDREPTRVNRNFPALTFPSTHTKYLKGTVATSVEKYENDLLRTFLLFRAD